MDPTDKTKNHTDTEAKPISKSARKREAHAITDLAKQLAALPPQQLARINLPQPIMDAISTLGKIKQHGAHKRQLLYLSKLMRDHETTAITEVIKKIKMEQAAQTQRFHNIEHWRDRIMDNGDTGISEFLLAYPEADRQRLRQLHRQVLLEQQKQQTPRAARLLFKYIAELINA